MLLRNSVIGGEDRHENRHYACVCWAHAQAHRIAAATGGPSSSDLAAVAKHLCLTLDIVNGAVVFPHAAYVCDYTIHCFPSLLARYFGNGTLGGIHVCMNMHSMRARHASVYVAVRDIYILRGAPVVLLWRS